VSAPGAAHPRPAVPAGPFLVVGLARSGVAAALALREAVPGARIVACDTSSPPEAASERERLAAAGVEVHLDNDGTQLLAAFKEPGTLVKSPGVPQHAPVVAEARRRATEVVGELELGWRLVRNRFLAVTGTNGKTTAAELLGAIYRTAGRPVAVAGNVGTPVSALAGRLDEDATVVCEVSSFQLEDATAFAPELALFLNFAEDHLDRHSTAADYLGAKLRVFANQTASDVAVLNASEPALEGADLGQARQVWFGATPGAELRLVGETIEWRGEPLMGIDELALRGMHNVENAMGAAAAALADGLEPSAVRSALSQFGGLPHRMETVRETGGVIYVNDSKATNVAAAAAALRSFPGGVHVILGGSLKGGSFAALAPVVADRCRACYLIGEAAERLTRDLSGSGVELIACGVLDRAVAEASSRAQRGETVLLAPACASFDQFTDYQERGERFRDLVHALRERD
jgi:UDP-N-acetylmuramoylalanine--D-glutamate ligase